MKQIMNEEEKNLKELQEQYQIDKPKKRFYFIHAIKQTFSVMLPLTFLFYIFNLIWWTGEIIKWNWIIYAWIFIFIISGLGAYPIFKIKR